MMQTRTPPPPDTMRTRPQSAEIAKQHIGTLARAVLFHGLEPAQARRAFDRITQGGTRKAIADQYRFFRYVMRTAYAPLDAVAAIRDTVTAYRDQCGAAFAYTVPGWVRGRTPDATAKYCALYHAALIAGLGGRVFQFACPAYGAAFGYSPHTVDRFRALAVCNGFMAKQERKPAPDAADGSTAPAATDANGHPERRKADLYTLAPEVRTALEDNQPLLVRVGSDERLRWLFAPPPPEDRAALLHAVFPSRP